MTFAFSLRSPFWFFLQIFLKIAPPYPIFGYFTSSFKEKKWDWEGVENYMYSSKAFSM